MYIKYDGSDWTFKSYYKKVLSSDLRINENLHFNWKPQGGLHLNFKI